MRKKGYIIYKEEYDYDSIKYHDEYLWKQVTNILSYKELIQRLDPDILDNLLQNMELKPLRVIKEYINEYAGAISKVVPYYCIVYYNKDFYELSKGSINDIKRKYYYRAKKYNRTKKLLDSFWYYYKHDDYIYIPKFRVDPIYRSGYGNHVGCDKHCRHSGHIGSIRENYDSEYKEFFFNKLSKTYSRKVNWDEYRSSCKMRNWKKQYKVKKQYMIHLKKHCDVGYDFTEEDSSI